MPNLGDNNRTANSRLCFRKILEEDISIKYDGIYEKFHKTYTMMMTAELDMSKRQNSKLWICKNCKTTINKMKETNLYRSEDIKSKVDKKTEMLGTSIHIAASHPPEK